MKTLVASIALLGLAIVPATAGDLFDRTAQQDKQALLDIISAPAAGTSDVTSLRAMSQTPRFVAPAPVGDLFDRDAQADNQAWTDIINGR